MALEVLRMLVHEVEEIVHQLAEGAPRGEACHDGHEAGVAASENLHWPDCLARGALAGDRFPQPCTLLGIERLQGADPE